MLLVANLGGGRFLDRNVVFCGVLLFLLVPVATAEAQSYSVQDLGTLGGRNSEGFGVNNNGQVVGWSDLPGSAGADAFFFDGTTMNDLGTLGGTNSSGEAINDAGQIAGSSKIFAGVNHAFISDGTSLQDLGTLGGSYSEANGINANGQVVGWAHTKSAVQHAFLYDGTSMQDLGTLGGTYSIATAINNIGTSRRFFLKRYRRSCLLVRGEQHAGPG